MATQRPWHRSAIYISRLLLRSSRDLSPEEKTRFLRALSDAVRELPAFQPPNPDVRWTLFARQVRSRFQEILRQRLDVPARQRRNHGRIIDLHGER